MPKPKMRTKSWAQVWKNSPDSTYDAAEPSRESIAKQYAKEAAKEVAAGRMDVAQANTGLRRVQGK